MKSKFLSLNVKDFLWGLFYSLTPVLIPLSKVFTSGHFPPADQWYTSLMQSIPIVCVYLAVHFFKNSNGNIGAEK